jgi:hypothetical protein
VNLQKIHSNSSNRKMITVMTAIVVEIFFGYIPVVSLHTYKHAFVVAQDTHLLLNMSNNVMY